MRAYKRFLNPFLFSFVCFSSFGQDLSSGSLARNLTSLDTNRSLSSAGKLKLLYEWKRKSDAIQLPQDSVYARLLHKMGVYEWFANRNYNQALALTFNALRINRAQSGATPAAGVTDLYNIAFFYQYLNLQKKALIYYDSAILLAGRGPDPNNIICDGWLEQAYICYSMGDYEKAVAESNRARIRALERGDSLAYLKALNQRGQALFYQGDVAAAQDDIEAAIRLAQTLRNDFQLASAYKTQGVILGSQRSFVKAEASFLECIATRLRLENIQEVSGDYNDLGAFYSDSLRAYQKAASCYLSAMEFAQKEGDTIKMARANVNLGRCYYYQGGFDKAMTCFARAASYLKIGSGDNLTPIPTAGELAAIGNKSLIQTLFNTKTATLLEMYRRTHDRKWLTACLAMARLNDSLIRMMRHEQVGEQSKLYWRNRTRGFFADALAACYFAKDNELAFHFLEESRSVLLQDKLNELGARAHLPPAEAAKAERMQIHIIELQQKLNSAADSSAEARVALQELLAANESREQYIRSLERDYPVYYQYKYADEVQPLSSLQAFLSRNKQRFIEYFVEDSLCFALCVEPTRTSFIRVDSRGTDIGEQMLQFVRFCSDENAQNSRLSELLARGNELYLLLLQPFGLSGGRVVICQDNVLVPFEAFSTDPARPDFLVKDYSFSYVYSARYLMSQHEQGEGKGDFLGIAPVKFAAYSGLADLRLSEDALRNCSTPYNRRKLLLYADANRQNFIRQVCNFTTTTILTHARSDSGEEEPVLFLNDSLIHLSELQMLSNPASRLVVLSACQTNVGKTHNGEGIFSLARGFSAAGIPSVAATQWMADEGAIYSISQKFNEYIFLGMNKDEALRKAKLYYMLEDRHGSLLPCYWADMVLIGDAEPVSFSKGRHEWLVVMIAVLALLLGVLGWYRARR